MKPDPDHPILDQPWTYEIIGLNYQRPAGAEPYLDLTLQRDKAVRRLRFYSPSDIRVTRGFPSSSGLCILDVSGRQLEGIGVKVANFENSSGCPEFFARDVSDLDSAQKPS